MAAGTGIFNESEVAVMVGVVLLTTLVTPLIMRGAFALHCPQDLDDSLAVRAIDGHLASSELSMAKIESQR
jgi:hypothetical protein